MSQRNKRGKTGAGKTAAVNIPPDQLEARVRQALSAAQYKQAIQYLKLLSKQAGGADLLQPLLQEAYEGRAEQLAGQGMFKEAAAIWEVAIPYGLDPADSRYIGWLVQVKQYPRLLDVYRKIPVENRRSLQPLLAAAMLSGAASSWLGSLPDEDPVRTGYGPARQLLEAWCGGESAEQLHERMKAIPFRSPYRDLRQAIHSWLLLENVPEQVRESLERIAPDSPFRPLADQAQLVQLPLQEALPQLSALSPAARDCQLEARGWSDSGVANLLRDLGALAKEPSATQLFAFLARVNAAQLQPHARHWWRDTTMRVFVVAQESSSKDLPNKLLDRVIGKLSFLDEYHFDSLSGIATTALPLDILSELWEEFRNKLLLASDKEPAVTCEAVSPADRRLAAALINRYLAAEWQKKEGRLTEYSAELLRDSLQYDPSDRKVWWDLIEQSLQNDTLVNARNTLKEALEHHPDDISILEQGVRVAVGGGAFKKAAGYAKRILELDPINTRVRQHVQNAHISHARKLLNKKKWDLARKELAEAREWKSTPLNATILQILQAYLEHQDGGGETNQGGDHGLAHPTLQQLMTAEGMHPAALDFLLRHESILVGLSDRAFLQLANVADYWGKPGQQGVLALIDISEQLLAINPDTVTAPLHCLRSFLKKAARLKFTESEGKRICEFWLQAKQNELLVEYANRLHTYWPKKPIFVYYRFYHADPFTNSAFAPLKAAMEQAVTQGDLGLTSRIEALLQRIFDPPISRLDYDFDDGDMGFDEREDFDDIDQALKLLGEGSVEESMRHMADMVPLVPYKEVAGVLSEILNKKKVNSLQKRFGEKAMRDLCQMILRGGDPFELVADLEGRPVKKKPVQGRLF